MTMLVGSNITKQDMVDTFNARIGAYVQSRIVWHAGNVPPDFPGALTTNVLPQLHANEIPDTAVTAATLVSLIIGYCRTYTYVRQAHFKKVGSLTGTVYFEDTQVAALDPATYSNPSVLDSAGSGYQQIAGRLVTVEGWDAWMNDLKGYMDSSVVQTVEFLVTVVETPPPPPEGWDRGRR